MKIRVVRSTQAEKLRTSLRSWLDRRINDAEQDIQTKKGRRRDHERNSSKSVISIDFGSREVLLTNCLVRVYFDRKNKEIAVEEGSLIVPTLAELCAFAVAILSDKRAGWGRRLRKCGAPKLRKVEACEKFFLTDGAKNRPRARCSEECDQLFERFRKKGR